VVLRLLARPRILEHGAELLAPLVGGVVQNVTLQPVRRVDG
jgi:hypothetical protein